VGFGTVLLGESVGGFQGLAMLVMVLGVALHIGESHWRIHAHGGLEHEHMHVHDEHHQHQDGNDDPARAAYAPSSPSFARS
jgi:hypothetical protein